jgi:hypothetical protein
MSAEVPSPIFPLDHVPDVVRMKDLGDDHFVAAA